MRAADIAPTIKALRESGATSLRAIADGLKKTLTNNSVPFTEATLPFTFSMTLLPTFSDLIRNVCDGTVEPSASLYVF